MNTATTLSPSLTLRRFVDEFYIVERPVGKSGVSQLRDMVRVVNQFARRELTLGDLNENLISQWIPWLEERYASETCKGKRRQLLGVWRYAADLDAIPEPKPRRVRKVRKPAPIVECWTMDEVAKLIDAVPLVLGRDRFAKMSSNQSSVWYDNNLTATYYQGVDPVKLWVCFIRVALDSGLRLGDVMHIRKADIGADGVITIRQAKTGNPVVCQLSPEAMQAIADTFGPDREYIFPGWRTWRQKFHKRFKSIVKAAGIRPGTAKWLRRTRATYAEKSTPGMARVVLGHTSSDTWRRYFDVRVGQAPPPMAPRIEAKIEAVGSPGTELEFAL